MKRAGVVLIALLFAACEGGDGACATEALPADCAPLYPADSFDELHRRTLLPKCASGGCHDSYAAKGGLNVATADAAYQSLVGEGRVVVDGCSSLLERIDSDDPSWVMPPGHGLSLAERCVIHTWVREGARR